MRHRTLALLAVLAAVLTACGSSGPAVESPTSPDGDPAATGQAGCRAPLADDAPSPIGQASGQHAALDGTWPSQVAERVGDGAMPDTAGVWMDQEAGEMVVMVTADDPSAVLAELRAGLDPDQARRVVCMTATHSWGELWDLLQVTTERLAEAGIPASAGIDTVRNRVEVDHEGDPDEVAALLGDLAAHPALVVRRPDCADVVPLPDGAVALPGDGSTCSGMDALLTGTLAGDAATGCLWIEFDGQRTSIVWPRGWYVLPDGTVHDHHGQARATIGDQVGAGGGFVGDEGAASANPCDTEGGGYVLSSLDPADDAG